MTHLRGMLLRCRVSDESCLLSVSYYLLLNVAEDVRVEMKMQNKGIVRLLCKSLERENQELLILVVSFLKKMSVFVENKKEMVSLNFHSQLRLSLEC